MHHLVAVTKKADIFQEYLNTPVGLLLEYHDLNRVPDIYQKAEILVGMCMDSRKYLRIPDNFAYIIRTGGGNLRYSEFKVSYAISIGGVSAIALIAHNHCGMVNLFSIKERFIDGMIHNAGWDYQQAEEHFLNFAPMFEIGNEIDFVLSEAARLRLKYPKTIVAPLFYQLEDNLLYLIKVD